MVKNKSDNDIDDYLSQVEWENQQTQRRIPLPWYMEPKWKSKKVNYSSNSVSYRFSPLAKIFLIIFISVIGFVLYKVQPVLLIAFFGLGIFVFFMIRDANSKPKD